MLKKGRDNIICYCNNITYSAIHNILNKNPGLNFKDFQNLSNAGTSCTACIPRLENIFVEKSGKNQNFKYSTISPKIFNTKSFIFSLMDKMLINLPVTFHNYFPIIFRKDIQTKIWVSNFGNLYKDLNNVVEHKLRIKFFNSFGSNIWKYECVIKKNENKIIEIPIKLLEQWKDDEWSSGWIHIEKKSLSAGYKGTTRPQIQILTKNSSCSVHGQDIKTSKGGFHSFINNPMSEKQLLSFFNIGKKKIHVKLEYLNKKNEYTNFKNLILDPYNSKIIELKINDRSFQEFDLISIRWRAIGLYKAHIFITDNKFQRISLDHL
jgi:bacterioferritin-associated ferredoxin